MALEAEDQQAEAQDEAGDATALARQVNDGLMKLAEILNSTEGATPKDQAQMGQIQSLFQDLVENKLGAAPGEDMPEEEAPMPDMMSAMGGRKGVPMGPQGKM
jgi:hypothetical protein